MSMLVKQAQRRLGEVEPRPETVDDQQRHVVEPLFKDLAAINRAKRSRLVVVFLPKRKDWIDSKADGWRRVLAAAAPRDGYSFVDLVDESRQLPRDSLDSYFLRDAHYGNRGHERVADRIVQPLRALPDRGRLTTG
jgi:hypothetical protein